MKKKILGAKALARLSVTFSTALILTLLGIISSGGWLGVKALLIFLANWGVSAFVCAYNDVEDWQDDILDEKKKKRNPICNGSLSLKEATLISFAYGLIPLVIFILISIWNKDIQIFIYGFLALLVSFFYDWKKVRLKSIPIIDFISHGYMLSAAQFICAYYAFNTQMNNIGLLLLLASYTLSIHGDFENENRDFEIDKKTKINNTAQLIGNYKVSRGIQYLILLATLAIVIYTLTQVVIKPMYIYIMLVATFSIFAILFLLIKTGKLKEDLMGIINASPQIGILIAILSYFILK